MRLVATVAFLAAAGSPAAEKPLLTYKAPPSGEDDRPVITAVVFGPQGSDYALRVQFDKAPWGESCRSRCANATLFLDTDNNRATGLKLDDPKAVENGADLAVTIQGLKEVAEGALKPTLKVKVTQYSEAAQGPDQGTVLNEISLADGERVLAEGSSVYLLVDASFGEIPQGPRVRVVYHPPGAKPLSGLGRGLAVPGASHVEIYQKGKLQGAGRSKGRAGGGAE